MPTDRTTATQALYEEELARRAYHNDTSCYMCSAQSIGSDSNHWRRIINTYPYDARYTHHHMLVLKDHAGEPSDEAWLELKIWRMIASREGMEFHINPFGTMSIREHFHVHLLQK